MRHKNFLIGIVLMIFLPLFFLLGVANAQSFRSGTNVTVSQNQIINSTLFAAGRNIDIAGTVNGDVFCAGQNITVSGTIHGDVICAGQTVNIRGTVDGNIRTAGQTVTISAKVSRNISTAGQNVTMDSSARAAGDVMVASTDAFINGSVGRDLSIGANTASINNSVGRDVTARVNQLTLESGANISGNLNYTSNNNVKIDQGAKVAGTTTKHAPQPREQKRLASLIALKFVWGLYTFVSLLLVAVVLALLFPSLFHDGTKQALNRPWWTLLYGFLTLILAPVIISGLMLTLVGIPLGILLLLFYMVILFVSGPAFGYLLGKLIMPKSTHPVLIILVGSVVLIILYFIPIISFVAVISAIFFGSGIVVGEAMRRIPKPTQKIT